MKVPGISPKLPLSLDEQDGYALNKTYKEMAQQNLKMLLLTIPGERIMDPNFGVGLKTYFFEQNVEAVHDIINKNINKQIETYLPYIKIISLYMVDSSINPELDENYLHIYLKYWIGPLGEADELNLDFDLDRI